MNQQEMIVKQFTDRELDLAALRDRVAGLSFRATWCPPCRAPHAPAYISSA